MTVDDTIRAAVLASGAVSALISNRLYPVTLIQNPTYPAAVMQRIATERLYSQDQTSAKWGTNGWARIQFSIFGSGTSGADQARGVADAIRGAIKLLPGFVLNELEQVATTGTVPPVFMRILDTRIFITEES